MQQEPRMVRKVLEFRLAEATVQQFNEDASKMTPEMLKMMKILQENFEED